MRIKEKIVKSGYFWLHSTPDKKIPGVLLISDGGRIDLEVVGLFDDSINGLNSVINGRANIGRIIGHIETYGLITLDDCFYSSSGIPLGGIIKSVVCVNKAYLGVAYDDGEPILFNEFIFSVEGIDEWVGVSGINVDHDFAARSATITYQKPQEISIGLRNGMRLLITFQWTLPGFPVTKEAKITQKIFFKLVSDEVCELNEFISAAYMITTLLCFAIDRTVCLEKVSATSKSIVRDNRDGTTVPVSVEIFYASLPYDKNEPKIDRHSMLFYYGQIKDDAEKIINNWIAAYDTIDPAINLYFAVRTGTHKYLDSKFLALAQGLETLHRRTSNETMMDQSGYLQLITEIAAHCPEDHKKWLSGRLTHGNEIIFSRRLMSIVDPCKKHIGSKKDIKKLIRVIVDTRNYLTHYDEESKKNAVGGYELYPLCLKMEAIFQLQLLRILGFTREEVDSIYENSSDLQGKLRET